MITFRTPEAKEHFLNVMKFAVDNDCINSLIQNLDYLRKYGNEPHHFGTNYETQCYLMPDFMKNSFSVHIVRRDDYKDVNSRQNVLVGGLIYHEHEKGWQVHT